MGKPFKPTRRRSKYNAVRVTVDGIAFDSKKEAERYGQLLLLLRAGSIAELVVHPNYPLDVNDVHICDYEADFRYFDKVESQYVVEDVKGVRTPEYRIKKQLLLALYGIVIKEV